MRGEVRHDARNRRCERLPRWAAIEQVAAQRPVIHQRRGLDLKWIRARLKIQEIVDSQRAAPPGALSNRDARRGASDGWSAVAVLKNRRLERCVSGVRGGRR